MILSLRHIGQAVRTACTVRVKYSDRFESAMSYPQAKGQNLSTRQFPSFTTFEWIKR